MKIDQKKKRILGGVGVLFLVVVGWLVATSHYEDTDNAYLAGHVATLSPKVNGIVTEVLVEENFKVKKDQVLARIDSRDYVNALNKLKAELAGLNVSLNLAEKDYRRSAMLFSQKAVTEQDRDNDSERVQELKKKSDAVQAQISQAELNLSFTELKAPSDGTIGKKLIEPGMVVNAGQPLLSFVDSQAPWVVANFKETQLKKMKIGQHCEIEIDSIGGKVFEGAIESFSPGTGATFALIPPDNATGNFTKIVQRLPVRIRFLPESIKGYEDRLVPGLSAEAKVYLNQKEVTQENSDNAVTKISEK